MPSCNAEWNNLCHHSDVSIFCIITHVTGVLQLWTVHLVQGSYMSWGARIDTRGVSHVLGGVP